MGKEKEEIAVPNIDEISELKDIINKTHGKGSIMTLDEKADFDPKNIVSTGSIGLDEAIGVGGLPLGRIIEIYGPESSGKTTLAVHVITEAQKKGGTCAFIDVEHAFDKEYAAKLGVDVDKLLISQPDYAEQALEITDMLVKSGKINVIVVDSVAALVPKKELEGEMGDSVMGLQARLMSQALRKLTAAANKSNTMIIFINQLREKIGVMFGNPETTTGGNGLKFYASVRLDVRRSITKDNSSFDKDGNAAGNKTTVKVIKNKVAAPFKKAEFDILYNVGIDKTGEIINLGKDKGVLALRAGIVTLDGTKYKYEDFAYMIEDNPDFKADIVHKINTAVPQSKPLKDKVND
jgi:recombination protein RecA